MIEAVSKEKEGPKKVEVVRGPGDKIKAKEPEFKKSLPHKPRIRVEEIKKDLSNVNKTSLAKEGTKQLPVTQKEKTEKPRQQYQQEWAHRVVSKVV